MTPMGHFYYFKRHPSIGLAGCAMPGKGDSPMTLIISAEINLSESVTAFKPAERGPGGGLTATYCTQLCNYKFALKNTAPPTRNAYFCCQNGAKMGPRWAKLGSRWGLESSCSDLGGPLDEDVEIS